MARDPKHRRSFEKLLYLAARHGDADLVAERLSWRIDPNCTFSKGRTPLIANTCRFCPSAATVRALLKAGTDPSLTDESGLTALDYARRKLARLQARPACKPGPPDAVVSLLRLTKTTSYVWAQRNGPSWMSYAAN
ncbi:MAG TPA: hypothetical protein VG099_23300 [Gemmataceae bacterium]|nr:hypothetical protein [Gemmataceae bacterium]